MQIMRAKMIVHKVDQFRDSEGKLYQENVTLAAVGKHTGYPPDGSDEDNTFARYTPSASMQISICNSHLFGALVAGKKFYLDFTPAD